MTAAFHFEAKKYALRQAKDGVIVSFVVHPDDVVAELLSAPIGEHYVVALAPYSEEAPKQEPIEPIGMVPLAGSPEHAAMFERDVSAMAADAVKRAREEVPTPPAPVEKERRPFHTLPRSTQAAMACNEERFREWLWPNLGPAPPPTKGHQTDWAARRVRERCGVTSRSLLDSDEYAARQWDALYASFLRETGQTTWERPS
jgi:hypothetical protein